MHEVGETTSEIGGVHERSLMTYLLHKEGKRCVTDKTAAVTMAFSTCNPQKKLDSTVYYSTVHSQLGTKGMLSISHTYSEVEVLVVL